MSLDNDELHFLVPIFFLLSFKNNERTESKEMGVKKEKGTCDSRNENL
jgi:hypothetical protein